MTRENVPEDLEELKTEYLSLEIGHPKEAEPLPEKWGAISLLPTIPSLGRFRVQVLRAGIRLGTGWEDAETTYSADLLARMEAYRLCSISKSPVRILNYSFPVCAFYYREDKMYIAVPCTLKEGRKRRDAWMEHQIFSQFDEVGGDIKEAEEEPSYAETSFEE